MRAVSYTRTTSCYPGEMEYPSDVIAIQNRHIGDYAKTNHMKLMDKYSDRKKDIHEKDVEFLKNCYNTGCNVNLTL